MPGFGVFECMVEAGALPWCSVQGLGAKGACGNALPRSISVR